MERFGASPNFAAIHSYETAKVLLANLKKTTDRTLLKEAILDTAVYQGVQGKIHIDQFGDPKRDLVLKTVNDGSFMRIQ